jgi:hypothetical protein
MYLRLSKLLRDLLYYPQLKAQYVQYLYITYIYVNEQFSNHDFFSQQSAT